MRSGIFLDIASPLASSISFSSKPTSCRLSPLTIGTCVGLKAEQGEKKRDNLHPLQFNRDSREKLLHYKLEQQHGSLGNGTVLGRFRDGLWDGTISAVVRLPFDPDRLVEILCEAEPAAANNPTDEEHTTFVVSACRSICEARYRLRSSARKGPAKPQCGRGSRHGHKTWHEARGHSQRRKMLEQLKERIVSAPITKTRSILTNPNRC